MTPPKRVPATAYSQYSTGDGTVEAMNSQSSSAR